jgi:hypothetical protein
MARFAVGLSLCLLVGSFAFAQTDPSAGILPCSCKLAGRTIPFGLRLRLPWPDSCSIRSTGSLAHKTRDYFAVSFARAIASRLLETLQ